MSHMPGSRSASADTSTLPPGGEVAPSQDDAPASVTRLKGTWWALHTKPRNEKALALDFDRHGITYYLPLMRHRRTLRGRPRYVDLPLFPGYVFLCGQWEDREAAVKTNRLVTVLDVPDQKRLMGDLGRVQRVLASNTPVDLYPGLRRGARCRIRSGPLAGLEGIVIRRSTPWKVYIDVQFIAQSAELEVDPILLDVID